MDTLERILELQKQSGLTVKALKLLQVYLMAVLANGKREPMRPVPKPY